MKYIKAILAAVFGLSPAAVVGILALAKIHVDETTVTYLIGILSPILATLGVAVGPANKTKAPAPVAQPEVQTNAIGLPNQISALWSQHNAGMDPATAQTPPPEQK